jgi:L-galactose dehydrogenase
MNYTTLGKTGLKVSRLGFGCAPLGNEYGDLGTAEATRTVHAAMDAGLNFFDTSPYYGRTLSEIRLGAALKGRRDEIVLATKGGRLDSELETGFDFSYASIMRMCEQSLARLQTDYLDVYQLHDIEFGRPEVVDEGIRALHDLKQQGKVRFIGVTGFPVARLGELCASHDLDVTLSYCHGNLMNQQMDRVLVPTVKERGIGLINASITHMGILTHQGHPDWHPAPEQVKAKGHQVAQFCEARGASLPALAIQYALANPNVDVTLLGTKTVAELETSVRLLDEAPDRELLAEVQALIEPVVNLSWPSGYEAYWETLDLERRASIQPKNGLK